MSYTWPSLMHHMLLMWISLKCSQLSCDLKQSLISSDPLSARYFDLIVGFVRLPCKNPVQNHSYLGKFKQIMLIKFCIIWGLVTNLILAKANLCWSMFTWFYLEVYCSSLVNPKLFAINLFSAAKFYKKYCTPFITLFTYPAKVLRMIKRGSGNDLINK